MPARAKSVLSGLDNLAVSAKNSIEFTPVNASWDESGLALRIVPSNRPVVSDAVPVNPPPAPLPFTWNCASSAGESVELSAEKRSRKKTERILNP